MPSDRRFARSPGSRSNGAAAEDPEPEGEGASRSRPDSLSTMSVSTPPRGEDGGEAAGENDGDGSPSAGGSASGRPRTKLSHMTMDFLADVTKIKRSERKTTANNRIKQVRSLRLYLAL